MKQYQVYGFTPVEEKALDEATAKARAAGQSRGFFRLEIMRAGMRAKRIIPKETAKNGK